MSTVQMSHQLPPPQRPHRSPLLNPPPPQSHSPYFVLNPSPAAPYGVVLPSPAAGWPGAVPLPVLYAVDGSGSGSPAPAGPFAAPAAGFALPQIASRPPMQAFENYGYVYPTPVPSGASLHSETTFMVVPSQPREDGVYYVPDAASISATSISQRPLSVNLNSPPSGTLACPPNTSQGLPQHPYSPMHAPRPSDIIGVGSPKGPQSAPDGKLLFLLTDVQGAHIDSAILPSQAGNELVHPAFGMKAPTQAPHQDSSTKATRERMLKKDASGSSWQDGQRSGNHKHTTALPSSADERRGGLSYEEDPSPIDTTKNQLIVNFLPQSVRSEELFTLFSKFGEQHKSGTKVIIDRSTCRSKGYGFVYFKDGQSTDLAIKTMNGYELHGRRIKVRYADQQRDSWDSDNEGAKTEDVASCACDCDGIHNSEDFLSLKESTVTEASTCADVSQASYVNDGISPTTPKSNVEAGQ